MTANLVHVPAKFYDDHADRLDGPRAITRKGNRVAVSASDPNLDELLADAEFYADAYGPDDLPPGLKASAQRTVAAIVKARGAA